MYGEEILREIKESLDDAINNMFGLDLDRMGKDDRWRIVQAEHHAQEARWSILAALRLEGPDMPTDGGAEPSDLA